MAERRSKDVNVSVKIPEGSLAGSQEWIVGKWHFAEGSRVRKDELIVEVEAEKVTQEIMSPATGILTRILIKEGEAALAGQEIGIISENQVL